MQDIASHIKGSHKLADILGYWPSFHDAEVLDLHFWRGDVDPSQKQYLFPVLTVKIFVWELTNETDDRGYIVLRNHTLTTLQFHDVEEFHMDGFNHQNAILGLSIDQQERTDNTSQLFAVRFDPAFGMSASFRCTRIEVVEAVRCQKDGKTLA